MAACTRKQPFRVCFATFALAVVLNSDAYGQGHSASHSSVRHSPHASRPSSQRSSQLPSSTSRRTTSMSRANTVSRIHSQARTSGAGAFGVSDSQSGPRGGFGGLGGSGYGGSGSSGGQLGHQGGFGGLGGGLGGFGGGQPYGGGGIPANRSVAQLSAQDQLRATYEANYRSAMAHGQPPPQYGSLPQFPENNGSWGDAILQALPHSGGVQVGVAGEASDPGGSLNIAGTSAMGGGVFWDPQKGWSTGDYASAGGLAKGPGSSGDGTGVAGTSGSAGASFWISNATSNTGLQNTNNNNLQLQRGHRADSRIHFGCDGR